MPSYLIVGASRGLGYQYLKTLSRNTENLVIGLARTPSKVRENLTADGITTVHMLPGDLTNPESLSEAADQVSSLTGGIVDYLIVNGAYMSEETGFMKPSDFVGRESLFLDELNKSMTTNVAGVLFSVNAFIPLVKKSSIKKVIVISTGVADPEFVRITGQSEAIVYALSKTSVNMLVLKYSLEYKDEGITFLALSPGLVLTAADDVSKMPPEVAGAYARMGKQFVKYDPEFKNPILPEESVVKQLEVIEKISLKDSGEFLSHHGNKKWLSA